MKETILSLMIIFSPLISVGLSAAEIPCDTMPDMSIVASIVTDDNAIVHEGHAMLQDVSQDISEMNMDCPCDHKASVSHSPATLNNIGQMAFEFKSSKPVILYGQSILPAISVPLLRPPIAA